MLLDAFFGKYGTPRMVGMWLFAFFAVIGLSVVFGDGFDAWKAGITDFAKGGIWVNVIVFLIQIYFITRGGFSVRKAEKSVPNPHHAEKVLEYEYDEFDDKFDYPNRRMTWERGSKPIPLDKILHHKAIMTYDRLYHQKRLYEKIGNQAAALAIQTMWQPWINHKYWKEHAELLKKVQFRELKKWEP